MASEFVSQYLNLIILQYQEKPKLLAEATAIIEIFENLKNSSDQLKSAFDIDTAVGNQLDIIGKIVGLNRKVSQVVPKVYFGFNNKNSNALGFGQAPFYKTTYAKYGDLTLNDEDYRFYLKAKISINFMKNNIHSINDIIAYLFNNNAYVVDNKDTTFTLYINENVNTRQVQYAKSLDLLPRPQTISYNNVQTYNESNTFGFNNKNPNALGFGQGVFSKILNF